MKKKVEKTELPKWKQDLFDSITDAVDRLTDEIGFISEDEHKKYIEKAFNDFEKEIKDEIDLVVLDAEELMKDKDFCSEAIYSIPLKDYSGTLLSQSKEMVKALQNLLEFIKDMDDYPYSVVLDAKEVLNKALNINQ